LSGHRATTDVQKSAWPCKVQEFLGQVYKAVSRAVCERSHTHSGLTLPLHVHVGVHERVHVCMNIPRPMTTSFRAHWFPIGSHDSPFSYKRHTTRVPLDFPPTGHIRECEPLFVHLVRLRASDRHLAWPGTTGQEPADVVCCQPHESAAAPEEAISGHIQTVQQLRRSQDWREHQDDPKPQRRARWTRRRAKGACGGVCCMWWGGGRPAGRKQRRQQGWRERRRGVRWRRRGGGQPRRGRRLWRRRRKGPSSHYFALLPGHLHPTSRAERRYGTPGLVSTIVYVCMINDPLLTYTACCKYLCEVATLRRAS